MPITFWNGQGQVWMIFILIVMGDREHTAKTVDKLIGRNGDISVFVLIGEVASSRIFYVDCWKTFKNIQYFRYVNKNSWKSRI